MSSISDTLRNMRKAGKLQDMKQKGDLGEDAALAVVYKRREQRGEGLLYQSFKYPYQTNRQGQVYVGNVFYDPLTKKFSQMSKETFDDEIDVLYITRYRVFPIEVKSYHAKLGVYFPWMNKNGQPVEKSPIAQAEKHARHLYHAIYDVLPDGKPDYIIPIVCFVDRATLQIEDSYAPYMSYMPVGTLNDLMFMVNKADTPLNYQLDLDEIKKKLESIKTSIKKTL